MSNIQRQIDAEVRWQHIPEPIRRLSQTNATVHAIAQGFIHGDIVTRHEMYCQMVLKLAAWGDQLRELAIDLAERTPTILKP